MFYAGSAGEHNFWHPPTQRSAGAQRSAKKNMNLGPAGYDRIVRQLPAQVSRNRPIQSCACPALSPPSPCSFRQPKRLQTCAASHAILFKRRHTRIHAALRLAHRVATFQHESNRRTCALPTLAAASTLNTPALSPPFPHYSSASWR
jgi:hypothetical protein